MRVLRHFSNSTSPVCAPWQEERGKKGAFWSDMTVNTKQEGTSRGKLLVLVGQGPKKNLVARPPKRGTRAAVQQSRLLSSGVARLLLWVLGLTGATCTHTYINSNGSRRAHVSGQQARWAIIGTPCCAVGRLAMHRS